ncbi:MAG: hypothetical protein FJX42_04410 [Alphaproteobacteria bacterium]|nr:hypothetical protein [Alphaproteobacteria bacterium]
MNMKTLLKTSVAAAALVAVAAPTMAQSNFETGQPKVKLKLFGHVNKSLMWMDDGHNGRTFVGDHGAVSTRMGFLATAPVTADVNFGALWEVEWKENNLRAVSVYNSPASSGGNTDYNQGDSSFVIRHQDVWVNHKQFGKLSLGQGSTAGDASMEANLSGATMVTGVGTTLIGTGTIMYDKAGKAYTSTTLGSVFYYPAGQGAPLSTRIDRVRYDTPRFMGFAAAASFSSGGEGAAGITYRKKVAAFDIDGRIGYGNISGISTVMEDYVGMSLAVLHDSGLNGSISHGRVNYKPATSGGATRSDAKWTGGSIGYIAKIFGAGPTQFAVDYYATSNAMNGTVNTATTGAAVGNDWDGTTFGLGVQQSFSDIGADIYLGYRNFSISTPSSVASNIDDVNTVITGIRVSF